MASSSVVLMCLHPFVTIIVVILTLGTKSDVMSCLNWKAGDLPRTCFGQPPILQEIIVLEMDLRGSCACWLRALETGM